MGIGNFNGNGSSNGSYQGNSSNGKLYEPTYYSRLRLRNDNENKNLTISYRSGLMIIEINEVDVSNGYKTTPLSTIFLSGMKASLLVKEIEEFKVYKKAGNITPNKAFGVNAGSGDKISYIGFSSTDGTDTVITIGKFNDVGKIMESNTFTLPKEYNYSLQWNDITSNDLVKVYRDDIDLEALEQAIADFARSYSGALGYGTLDLNRYEVAKDRRNIDQIFDRLGIERRTFGNNNYSGGGSNNFLNNASSSKATTIDEVTDLLED